MNECPEPVTRTVRPAAAASFTAAATSATSRGRASTAGVHCWLPAQLCQPGRPGRRPARHQAPTGRTGASGAAASGSANPVPAPAWPVAIRRRSTVTYQSAASATPPST